MKLKFEAIAGLDADRMKLYTEDMKKYSGRVQQNLLEINKKIEANTKNIEERKASFENNELRKREDEVIRGVTQKIRNDIKNPKQYKVSDWVEGLESMPDDELVMFNIASPGNSERAKKGIECILKHNGLSAGEKTNQWLIRHELRSNSDDGCYEIFSPIMTVKDAKEIMPKLMDDLETAHLSKGLVIPARPKELFKDVVKEPCSQDAIDTGLKNLVQAGKIREALTDPNLSITKEMEERALSRLGINSFDELPETYSSLKELEAKFPKDKYLFSGTMASDDYCQLSCRNGRVGKVYATPHIDYAAKYDGVTNVGAVLGTSATGDYYISPIAGKVNGNNVYVGFINVYEQNPDDKFFDGFGMESYRHKDFDIQGMEKTEIKSFDLWTPSPNGAVILHKQAKPADRHVLSREQAINGYIEHNHSMPTTIDGKLYYTASYNAETYVTPEKNPLKAKIMHLAYQDEYGHSHDLYVPVSDKSDEAVRHILNSRQAEMKDSFENSLKTDVYNRFEKQKEELNKGIVPQIRENDFECRKQAKFLAGESNTPVHTEKSQNIDRINQLRGVIKLFKLGKSVGIATEVLPPTHIACNSALVIPVREETLSMSILMFDTYSSSSFVSSIITGVADGELPPSSSPSGFSQLLSLQADDSRLLFSSSVNCPSFKIDSLFVNPVETLISSASSGVATLAPSWRSESKILTALAIDFLLKNLC